MATVLETAANAGDEFVDVSHVIEPIAGNAGGKNLLYMQQLAPEDIRKYIEEAYAAEAVINDPARRGIDLLPHVVLKAIMRQPSTRTGGSMTTAMKKLGGDAELISGMHSSSEAKGESLPDSWVAFATQSDIIGTRTAEDWGPARAAHAIDLAVQYGQLQERVPVINLGDGTKEHPTQALGDLFTIHKHFREFEGLKLAVVGDHERYRAHHSLLLGAAAMGMEIMTVESPVAPVPESVLSAVGDRLTARVSSLDEVVADADVLYLGRNPDEYDGSDETEIRRSRQLAADYEKWVVDAERVIQLKPEAIVMHPHPRRTELDPSVDRNHRMKDVEQMANMIPMRMAIIARHAGRSIVEATRSE